MFCFQVLLSIPTWAATSGGGAHRAEAVAPHQEPAADHTGGVDEGEAVQVDPMKPKLKPPGPKRLKLECAILLSTSAFKSNLGRYMKGGAFELSGCRIQGYDYR